MHTVGLLFVVEKDCYRFSWVDFLDSWGERVDVQALCMTEKMAMTCELVDCPVDVGFIQVWYVAAENSDWNLTAEGGYMNVGAEGERKSAACKEC